MVATILEALHEAARREAEARGEGFHPGPSFVCTTCRDGVVVGSGVSPAFDATVLMADACPVCRPGDELRVWEEFVAAISSPR